jgi:hypothetical protein
MTDKDYGKTPQCWIKPLKPHIFDQFYPTDLARAQVLDPVWSMSLYGPSL